MYFRSNKIINARARFANRRIESFNCDLSTGIAVGLVSKVFIMNKYIHKQISITARHVLKYVAKWYNGEKRKLVLERHFFTQYK